MGLSASQMRYLSLTARCSNVEYQGQQVNQARTELANQLGVELDETGHIIIDKNQKTNVGYVYAIGDVCVGLKQWVVACGEGAVAATSAYHDLKES